MVKKFIQKSIAVNLPKYEQKKWRTINDLGELNLIEKHCPHSPEELNTYFTSAFEEDPGKHDINFVILPSTPVVWAADEVYLSLTRSRTNTGTDEIPCRRVFRQFASPLSVPITDFLNISLRT